jgi:hypothetical protein
MNRQRTGSTATRLVKYAAAPFLLWLLWEGIARYTTVGCGMCRQWAQYDQGWFINETTSSTTSWTDQVPKCPCTVKQVHSDARWVEDHVPALHQPCTASYTAPGCTASSHRTQRPALNGAGNQCCYGINGGLITGGLSAGTIDRYAPTTWRGLVGHVVHDVLPFVTCCKLCRGDCATCDVYTKGRRPLHREDGCVGIGSDYVC